MPNKPLEVYGNLEYVGMDAEGKIHLFIRKNKRSLKSGEFQAIIKGIKKLENKDIRLIVSLLSWNNNVFPQTH